MHIVNGVMLLPSLVMHTSHHLTLEYYEHKIRNFMYLYLYVIAISHDELFVSFPRCLHHRLHRARVLNVVPVVHPTQKLWPNGQSKKRLYRILIPYLWWTLYIRQMIVSWSPRAFLGYKVRRQVSSGVMLLRTLLYFHLRGFPIYAS